MKIITLIAFSSVGLYGQWITGFYAPGGGRAGEPVSAIPWHKYTHVIQQQIWPNSDGTLNLSYVSPSDTWTMIAARPPGKKVLILIGDDAGALSNATSPGTIATFVNNIVNYVNANGYDGVDLDWEANVNATQFSDLISRLRTAMPTKVIAMDVFGSNELKTVANTRQSQLDQINLMCYDQDNAGNGVTWYNDALVSQNTIPPGYGGCDGLAAAFTGAGVAPNKIGVGIPFYGRRWTGCTQAFESGCTKVGYFIYQALATDPTRWQAQYQRYDTQYKSNYLSIPSLNEFDSYNGPEFMRDVAAWAKANGFGGFMTFGMTDEYLPSQTGDARYPLSTALYAAVFATAAAPRDRFTAPATLILWTGAALLVAFAAYRAAKGRHRGTSGITTYFKNNRLPLNIRRSA
jgi:GH18 family chitinase